MIRKAVHTSGLLLLWIALAGSGIAVASPVAMLVPEEAEAVLGEPFRVACRIQWSGAASDLRIHPAVMDDWAQGEARLESMEWSRDGDQQTVTQWLLLIPAQTGTVSTPALRIPFETADQPASDGIPATVVSPEPVSFSVTEPVSLSPVTYWGVALLVVLLGSGIAFTRRRRKLAQPEVPGVSQEQELQEALHSARQKRLDGDFYSCYQILLRIARQLPKKQESDTHQRLAGHLQERMEAVGFQGHRPTDDELDGDFKDLEAAVKKWMHHQAQDAS